jgi:hypothetical protein
MGGGNGRFFASSNVITSLIAVSNQISTEAVAVLLKGMLVLFIALGCGALSSNFLLEPVIFQFIVITADNKTDHKV